MFLPSLFKPLHGQREGVVGKIKKGHNSNLLRGSLRIIRITMHEKKRGEEVGRQSGPSIASPVWSHSGDPKGKKPEEYLNSITPSTREKSNVGHHRSAKKSKSPKELKVISYSRAITGRRS